MIADWTQAKVDTCLAAKNHYWTNFISSADVIKLSYNLEKGMRHLMFFLVKQI